MGIYREIATSGSIRPRAFSGSLDGKRRNGYQDNREDKAWSDGIELHEVDGVLVHITSIAKTIADCFTYRNKMIGLDVALESLRDAWRERRVSSDDLWRYAKVCRVANVMRPYLDSPA